MGGLHRKGIQSETCAKLTMQIRCGNRNREQPKDNSNKLWMVKKWPAMWLKYYSFLFLLSLWTGYFLQTQASPSQRSFQGCMQLIQVDDHLADLVALERGMLGAFENVSLDMCAIIDRSEHWLSLHPLSLQFFKVLYIFCRFKARCVVITAHIQPTSSLIQVKHKYIIKRKSLKVESCACNFLSKKPKKLHN